MDHVIEKVISHHWIAGLLLVLFMVGAMACWGRIRHDTDKRRD